MATITVKSENQEALKAFAAGINYTNDSTIEIIGFNQGELILEDEGREEDETFFLDYLID